MNVAIRRYQMAKSASGDEVLQRVKLRSHNLGGARLLGLLPAGQRKRRHGYFGKRVRGPRGGRRIDQEVAHWAREDLTSMLPSPPEVIAGEAGARESNLTKLGIREVRK